MPAWELAHKAGRKQNKKNATAFLFLAKELPKGMGEQSEANPKQEKRNSVLVSCKGTPKQRWASIAKPIPTKPAGSSLTG